MTSAGICLLEQTKPKPAEQGPKQENPPCEKPNPLKPPKLLKLSDKEKTQPKIGELFKPTTNPNPNKPPDPETTQLAQPTPKITILNQTLNPQSPNESEPQGCDIKKTEIDNLKPNHDNVGKTSAMKTRTPNKLKTKVVHTSDIKLFLETKKNEKELKTSWS